MDRAIVIALGAAAALTGLGVAPAACSSASDGPTAAAGAAGGQAASSGGMAGTAGTAGKGGAAGEAGNTPTDTWEVVDPKTLPDCGPGCTTLTGHLAHPAYVTYPFGETGVASVLGYEEVGENTPKGARLYQRGVDGVTRALVAPDGNAFACPGISAKYVIVNRTEPWLRGSVLLIDRSTGESRVLATYDQEADYPDIPGGTGVPVTAVNDKYAFWLRQPEGYYRYTLATGEKKLLTPKQYDCDGLYTGDDGMICGSTDSFRATFIDQETGEDSLLSPEGKALQVDISVSPNGRFVVWIDYRDPPGIGSTDNFRNGGEVYVHDRQEKTTKRMTFDSPSLPRGKTRPAVGNTGDTLVWLEVFKGGDPNPSLMQTLYYATDTLVRLDVGTGKKCRLYKDAITRRGGRSTLYGRSWYHYTKIDNLPPERSTGPYLAALDLDHPGLPWECE